jgi:outer membrane protein assembly factor BamB
MKHPGPIILFLALFCAVAARAADWPNWRGPDHNGISAESAWAARWPAEGPKQLWKAAVGTGFSSIAVSGGRAYTMGNQNDADSVFCFDAATGDLLWRQFYPCPKDPHYYEGGPSATPTVEGGRVFTWSKKGDLFCFDAVSGQVIWKKNLAGEIGAAAPTWGFASSPYIAGNILLLNVGTAGAAVDKTTGKTLWSSGADAAGYSTPVPASFGGQAAVVLMAKDAVVGLDFTSGKPLWRFPWKAAFDINVADTIIAGQKVFVSSSYKGDCALLQVKDGAAEVLWQNKELANQINSSVLLGGFLYGVDGPAGPAPNATLKCLDFQTGAVKWTFKDLGGGSFMVAAGKFIALSDKGELMTAEVSPAGFEPISRTQVLGGRCWTPPVLANARIYCRNAKGDLACFDVRPN